MFPIGFVFAPIFLILLGLIIGWYYIYFKFKRHLKGLPRPKQIPLLGIMINVRNTVDIYNVLLSNIRKLGKNIFGMLGPFPTLITSDPKMFALILGSPKHINKPPLYTTLENSAGNSLLLTNGDVWRRQRKLLNPGLDYTNVMQNINVFNTQSDDLIKALEGEINKESTELENFIETWALKQTYETMMGSNAPEEDRNEFLESIKTVMKIAVKRNVRLHEYYNITYVFTKNFWLERKCIKKILHHTKNIIEDKKKEIKEESNKRERPILVDILMKQKQTDKNVTYDFIAKQLNLMVAAGFDTSGSAICFALYNLAIFPEIQKKAYEELHSILGDDINQFITHQHVKEMKYLDLVIKESMRIKTTVPFFLRHLQEDVDFEGMTLPKGLTIMLLAYAMHLDPEVYPEPENFVPERFLKENLNPNRYSYAPFCGGVRNCIGQKYAQLSMKVVLAKILLHYELVDVNHELCLASEITLRSKTGVKVGIRKRMINNN
nr:probable cytochrome P450 4d14 [Onthophagus taurus]